MSSQKKQRKMTTESSSEKKITIKLLIDSKGKKVLFAEAGKDFADFLLTLLSLPVGTVIKLLSSKGMVGTLGKLYDSFKDLDETYIRPQVDKDTLLNPSSSSTILLLTNDDEDDETSSETLTKVYKCSVHCNYSYWSDDPTTKCSGCNNFLSKVMTYVAPPPKVNAESSEISGGFVKGVVTYMIMDDLEVKPMSTISSITMLNKFNVKDIASLQEKTVCVGMNEGLKLLKSSLETDSVLTSVFLKR